MDIFHTLSVEQHVALGRLCISHPVPRVGMVLLRAVLALWLARVAVEGEEIVGKGMLCGGNSVERW